MKAKVVIYMFMLSIIVQTAGCGTFMRASPELYGSPGELYPAVRVDLRALNHTWHSPCAMPVPLEVLVKIFFFIDIPISLVTDTLFLPIDLVIKKKPITIKVVDRNHQPMVGQHIWVRLSNNTTQKAVTDANGVFKFRGNHQLIRSFTIVDDLEKMKTRMIQTGPIDFDDNMKDREYTLIVE